jgi:N-acetylmuramic acid 6-phosphate etherase
MVIGKIAGGPEALTKSFENAEDDPVLGASEIIELKVTEKDVCDRYCGSGNTPYVLGALEEAQSRKALTIGIACKSGWENSRFSDIAILPVVGPEALTGSDPDEAGRRRKWF